VQVCRISVIGRLCEGTCGGSVEYEHGSAADVCNEEALVGARRSPTDGKQGQVLTVEFTVVGVPCLGLNGGAALKHSEAFSFQIVTED